MIDSPKINRLGWGLLLILLILTGCSKHASYHFGLVTQSIDGQVQLPSEEKGTEVFIIARLHHQTFMSGEDKRLERISAKLIRPTSDGFYTLPLESSLREVELSFFSRGYKVPSTSFRRSLGVGRITFNPVMEQDSNWDNNFTYSVVPMLSQYITEQRYQLPEADQFYIGEWIREIEKSIDSNKKP